MQMATKKQLSKGIQSLCQHPKPSWCEGDTIKLLCSVDKLENFVIIWKKGSGILAVGDKPFDGKDARIKIESSTNGNRLVISLADFSDEGEYTCQLSALKTVELKHSVRVRGKLPARSICKATLVQYFCEN